MTAAPEVTVVIPTRNRWDLLSRRALPSALAQEAVAQEVVVVDDASTDDTPAQVVAVDDQRVRLERLDERAGVAAARNAGIAAACGAWIAFLDDDDVWSPRKLRTQLDAVHEAGADFIYSGVVAVGDSGAVEYDFPLPPPAELPLKILSSSVLPAGGSNVLARTELVRAVGGFDEQLFQLADWDLWIRLAASGRPAATAEVLVGYFEHDENMLLTDPADVTRELAYLEQKHRALRARHGVELDRSTFLHWVAWGHLRRRQRGRAARVYLRSGIANRSGRDIALAAAFAARAVVPLGSLRRRLQALTGSRAPEVDGAAEPAWLELYR
jgi:glycosyltransferase involved in cell wall biosynthesis